MRSSCYRRMLALDLSPSSRAAHSTRFSPRNRYALINYNQICSLGQDGTVSLRKRGDPGLTWFGVAKMKRTSYRTRIARAYIDDSELGLL
eukprot:m.111074 g.111074  ORF g.111074 m.111074 type:complete len:90 (+) comp14346_c1_seq4:4466-4735(+)